MIARIAARSGLTSPRRPSRLSGAGYHGARPIDQGLGAISGHGGSGSGAGAVSPAAARLLVWPGGRRGRKRPVLTGAIYIARFAENVTGASPTRSGVRTF